MPRPLILEFRRRRAVSTMIGGLIILTLILTALGTMVFVSKQYDQYQQLVEKMGQYDSQQFSERLVINFPGLTLLTSTAISGWGSGCTTTYNCYNATMSNLGGVGVQIARIYINSTGPAGSGCSSPNPQPCILNPTSGITSYAFNQANRFLNPGELNHFVVLALPIAVSLPNPTPAFPQNTIVIATSRGNVFTFQWPVPLQIFGQSQSAFSSGIMKVAYQVNSTGGYDSKNEKASGGSGGSGYCHSESSQPYPAAAGYAEKLTGITGVTGNTLYFVNPWITETILESAIGSPPKTNMYIYVIVINTGQTAYAPTAGSIDLTWYSANHLDGTLLGVYYKGTFYPAASPPSGGITPTTSYYAIYKITTTKLGNRPSPQSVMFWGDASITNWSGSSSEDQSYFSATILVSGLWIRYACQ
jgi:hypothetical protein